MAFSNLTNRLNQSSFLFIQLRYFEAGFRIGCTIYGIQTFLRSEISHIVSYKHVDRGKICILIAAACSRLSIKRNFRVRPLIIVTCEQLVFGHLNPSSTHLSAGVKKFLKFTGSLVECCRHATSGRYKKIFTGCHEVTLRRHPSILVPPRLISRGIVEPDFLSSLRINSCHINPFVGKNSSGKKKCSPFQKKTGANRPQGNHSTIADHSFPARAGPIFPSQ